MLPLPSPIPNPCAPRGSTLPLPTHDTTRTHKNRGLSRLDRCPRASSWTVSSLPRPSNPPLTCYPAPMPSARYLIRCRPIRRFADLW
ncbi:hypothetical protein BD309DRAFT_522390 [Dichomitus squalens]|nr:hypothetical protein BD309DRAFT_522390 [Dichomitus squalens]